MNWNRSNPAPTPEQLAAWADGELNRADAERVEAWLAAHPDAADEAEPGRIVHLYRDHPPPEPTDRAWQATLHRIAHRTNRPGADVRRAGSSWKLRLVVGLAATAAAVGGLVVARNLLFEQPNDLKPHTIAIAPEPASIFDDEPDGPFPVVTLSEVEVISISPGDADRVTLGQLLLGNFEVAGPEDIDIVKLEPDPEDGQMPRIHRGLVPMILLAAADREEP
jgi:hypothetical protein